MQLAAKNQKWLAVDDELGRSPALLEVRQPDLLRKKSRRQQGTDNRKTGSKAAWIRMTGGSLAQERRLGL